MSTESPQQITFSFRTEARIARQYQGELQAIIGPERVRDLLYTVLDGDEIAFSYIMDIRGLEPGCAAFYAIARLFEAGGTKTEVSRDELERLRGVFVDLLQSVDRIKAVCDGR
jgi:hypothetical protein